MTKPRYIFFDIETLPIVATTWTLWPKSISHENILTDWSIACAAWKEAGSTKVSAVSMAAPGDDYLLCKKLSEALSKADVLITHNGDKFDIKKLNARLITHKLPPLPLIPTIDTLKQVKKIAAFTSNRLDFLAKTLIGEGKMETNYSLWKSVMNGSKKDLKYMSDYCKVDVIRLEQVYNHLKPYIKATPHFGVLMGKDRALSCNSCGSSKVKKNGVRVSASGTKRQEIKCESCGHYSSIPLTKIK